VRLVSLVARPPKIDDRKRPSSRSIAFLGNAAGDHGGSRGGPGRFWHRIEKRPRRRRNGGFGFRREYARAWWPRGAKAATSRGSPVPETVPGPGFSGRRQAMSEAQRSWRLSPRAGTYLLECKRIIAKERRSCQKDARWCRARTPPSSAETAVVFFAAQCKTPAPTDKDRNIAHC